MASLIGGPILSQDIPIGIVDKINRFLTGQFDIQNERELRSYIGTTIMPYIGCTTALQRVEHFSVHHPAVISMGSITYFMLTPPLDSCSLNGCPLAATPHISAIISIISP